MLRCRNLRALRPSQRGLSSAALNGHCKLDGVHQVKDLTYDIEKKESLVQLFEPSRIRNFSIIAHIDHGKSTLADALLVRTGNITAEQRKGKQQQLDTLQVERERGITVKAQTASMLYRDRYLLNLIDTPGHVDFSYEVVRSLASCQGALLLVDAAQGIQAQTLSTYHAALEAGIGIIPVVTKIDLPNAAVDDTVLSLATTFNCEPEDVICTSAKAEIGMDAVLDAIVHGYDPAAPAPLRARIVDTWFDHTRGVICLVQCVDGCIREGDRISSCHLLSSSSSSSSNSSSSSSSSISAAVLAGGADGFNVQEVGVLSPAAVRTRALWPGQVGYVIAGMKNTRQALLGDTLIHALGKHNKAASIPEALPLFRPSKSMLFASVYPMDGDGFETLLLAVERLALNDASLEVEKESSTTLGNGLRVGFLGMLHMEVFHQRLQDEFNMPVLLTTPNVPYTFVDTVTGASRTIVNLDEWQSAVTDKSGSSKRMQVLEPMVEATVISPADCLGNMLGLLKDKRGTEIETKYIDEDRVVLKYKLPWAEVVTDFHDKAKNISSGYASFNYREIPPEAADLVLCEMTINTEPVDALSFVGHKSKVQKQGREMAERLKKVIQRQQFEVIIQARIGGKPFARERIPPYRKDVMTTKAGKTVGGGDVSRKKKLLEKQKEGKKRSKSIGRVTLTQEAFWSVLAKD